MKITHNKVGQNLNLTDAGKAEKTDKADKAKASKVSESALDKLSSLGGGDTASKVSVSERAQDIRKAKEIAMAAPEIREDRVAELQKMIDGGKYKVASKDIADKMVDEEAQWS